jgi:hypothetical protein
MRLNAAMLGMVLLSGCGDAPADEPSVRVEVRTVHPPEAPSPTPTPGLPVDVVAFRLKRDECDQLRGEEPTGPARAAALRYGMERTCTGTDAALRALRQRHAGDPAVIAALAGYDDAIE